MKEYSGAGASPSASFDPLLDAISIGTCARGALCVATTKSFDVVVVVRSRASPIAVVAFVFVGSSPSNRNNASASNAPAGLRAPSVAVASNASLPNAEYVARDVTIVVAGAGAAVVVVERGFDVAAL